jgi:co-chaperonin GroES (HSP10)
MKLAYSAHRFDKHQIHPLNDSVIVTDMTFDERFTTSGIVLLNDNGKSTGIRPRWGQVYAVGPTQLDVKAGQYILISHGRWTRGIKIDDGTGERIIRKVDPNDILMVSDEPMTDETMSDKVF